MDSLIRCSGHVEKLLRPDKLNKIIEKSIETLNEFGPRNFDAIAFRGMSGALIASPVAAQMGKKLFVVRKFREERHSWYGVEGWTGALRYIILDDVISTGSTIRNIIESINDTGQSHKLVGILLYNDDVYYTEYKPDKIKDLIAKIPIMSFNT